MIDLGKMPREGVLGMLMNIEALEAAEDLRQAKLTGAVFGAKNGREYLEFLASMAFWDDHEEYKSTCEQIAIADSARGLAPSAPPDVAKGPEDIGG